MKADNRRVCPTTVGNGSCVYVGRKSGGGIAMLFGDVRDDSVTLYFSVSDDLNPLRLSRESEQIPLYGGATIEFKRRARRRRRAVVVLYRLPEDVFFRNLKGEERNNYFPSKRKVY